MQRGYFTWIAGKEHRSMSTQGKGVKTLLLLGWVLAWGVSTALAQASHGRTLMHAVDAIGMTVADMDRSLVFYTQVLSFTLRSDVEVTGSIPATQGAQRWSASARRSVTT